MKGRINRRGAEPRWAPAVHQGRSDEEIIEMGPSPPERGRHGERELMRCRRVAGDWMISSRELAAFPAKFPVLREGSKAILMAKILELEKWRQRGQQNTIYWVIFPFHNLPRILLSIITCDLQVHKIYNYEFFQDSGMMDTRIKPTEWRWHLPACSFRVWVCSFSRGLDKVTNRLIVMHRVISIRQWKKLRSVHLGNIQKSQSCSLMMKQR